MPGKRNVGLLALNCVIGILIVLIVFFNIFALAGFARFFVSVLSFGGGITAIVLLSSRPAKKRPAIPAGNLNDPDAAVINCAADVRAYLRENCSTEYFRDQLSLLLNRLDAFAGRCESIRGIIAKRFGTTGMSYGKFLAPVEMLTDYLVKLTNGLVHRMRVFNEEEYVERIAEFMKTGRHNEAAEYQKLQKEYMAYAEQTLAAFDESILKLDKLSLEISKLSENETERAMRIMSELDEIISATRLYSE
jgi:hypothetical protein